jgi:transcriptional regulator with XRE-family HTH domain
MKFGETLKKLRESKGLTQEKLSEQSGIALRTVQRIERDEVNPSLHSLNALGRVLDVNLTSLRSSEETTQKTTNSKIMEIKDEHLWNIALKRAKFRRSIASYSIIIPFLWAIWFLTTPEKFRDTDYLPWPIWPMFGWGIGLAFQYLGAYYHFSNFSAEAEYEKLKNLKN